jgi:outer membrane protein assembly factor BamD (BamD/ComL family)
MKSILVSLVAAALLASCSGRNARDLFAEARSAEDSGKFTLALEKYEEVVRDYPAEAVAETAMYRLVVIRSNSTGDKGLAVESQRRFLELFPKSLDVPKVMFMLAFNYNNEMHQLDSARKYYELFLASYPGHELAPSAKFELETLGKGPEELLGDAGGEFTEGKKTATGSKP